MLADPAAYGKAIGSQGCLGRLIAAVEREVPEEADQVVGHHDEAERGFRGPKVLQAERVEVEVLLQFPDPVLAVRAAVIDVPNLI